MNAERYREKIGKMKWGNYYENENINELNEILVNNICSALDEEAPMKIVQKRKNHASWMDARLKQLKQERDERREKARETREENDWKDYRKTRNMYNKEITKTKK